MLTPAFHFKILQNYAAVNIEQTNIFLANLCVNVSCTYCQAHMVL